VLKSIANSDYFVGDAAVIDGSSAGALKSP